ncbi:uncharacterized protein C5orf46 homolog isoform X1 [Cervus elaphus]|uniref:uncharacterized protein C5orf46 homolog isoform X1 n=1 Tax=Cervus elaphus TaxID=9860 RepID=UPI001CC2C93A|nr:uncharacterized protein C5orf46 homolog isoform X1 [Cervus elaphus]
MAVSVLRLTVVWGLLVLILTCQAENFGNMVINKENIHQSDFLRTHLHGSRISQGQPNPAFPVLFHKSSWTEDSKRLPASAQNSGPGFNQTQLILNILTLQFCF